MERDADGADGSPSEGIATLKGSRYNHAWTEEDV